MGQVSAFLRRTQGGYSHWCPACNEMHGIAVERALANGARWSFDGNVEAPTFNPSINISAIDDEEGILFRCHYHLHAGVLKFLLGLHAWICRPGSAASDAAARDAGPWERA